MNPTSFQPPENGHMLSQSPRNTYLESLQAPLDGSLIFDIRNDPTPEFDPSIPNDILPHEKIYSIQVGNELSRLSGASLSSDAPSYFTNYFKQPEKESTVLFIDRSPIVFIKIYHHLQGYHINVEDEYEFVYLFADAYYFNLPRLKNFLVKNDVFARIGDQSFRFSKKLFSRNGDYPNFFTIHYDTVLRDNINIIESKNIIRPPPQAPATVINHSAELFANLLSYLQGNELVVKSEEHRNLLLKECRYYRFLNLEQRLIKHKITTNPFSLTEEIVIGLYDLKKEGFLNPSTDVTDQRFLQYRRPYMEEPYRDLNIQINSTEGKLFINRTQKSCCFKLYSKVAKKFANLFGYLTNDLIIEDSLNCFSITFITDLRSCHCTLNNIDMKQNWLNNIYQGAETASINGDVIEIKVLRSQWKISCRTDKMLIVGSKLEGVTDESFWYKKNEFL